MLIKYRKIKIFIKLKFIIRFSNMFVHTCWCIKFIMTSGVDPKLQSNLECFLKGFENGFEIKEKKEKKIRKIKVFLKL